MSDTPWYAFVGFFPVYVTKYGGIRGAALRTASQFSVVPRQNSRIIENLWIFETCSFSSFNNYHLFRTIVSLTLLFIYKSHRFDKLV